MDNPAQQDLMFSQTAANINALWASLLIEELVRHGITDFCIAPGSRSTPLTLAVANRQDVHSHVHFDERGLGFLALGIALARKKPVVLITTSGTAVANLYPAVIEARQSKVPLIILSADRPPELIDCGANQAINQHAIFSDYPVFFKQIPSPTEQIQANYLLTTLNQGLSKQTVTPAPIHFNLAFPEPLYPGDSNNDYQEYLRPLKKWLTSDQPFTRYQHNSQGGINNECKWLNGKKIIVIAGRLADLDQAQAIGDFAKQHHYPLLSDIQSSLTGQTNSLGYYDLLLINPEFQALLAQADLIIQFGDKLISKRLGQFISAFAGEYWLIEPGEQCIDPDRQLSLRINSTAKEWIAAQTSSLTRIDKSWLTALTRYQQAIAEQVITPFIATNELSEINLVSSLDKLMVSTQPLFIGNSMPIRLCDMLMTNHQAKVYSNRGASGIDGLLATAIGVAKGGQQPTTLLIGDTSLLYDLNSLALLAQLDRPFIIIVINNDGGSIFNLLPVPAAQQRDFYQLPHGLTFAAVCKQFAIEYFQPKQLDEFTANYQTATKKHRSLIEVCTNNDQTYNQLAQLKEHIQNATF